MYLIRNAPIETFSINLKAHRISKQYGIKITSTEVRGGGGGGGGKQYGIKITSTEVRGGSYGD